MRYIRIQFNIMSAQATYIEKNKKRFLEELFSLIRIPSISADSNYASHMQTAAQAVADALIAAGCTHTELCPTAGYPIVYGEKIIDPSLPTVLVYGHYDVQPPDPLDLWDTPPFEPEIRKTDIHPEGAIFARGACDDKGQMFMHIKALEVMEQNGGIPCNIKFMIEGEEEVGSDNLETFVRENTDKLDNDVILISDTGMLANDIPSITTGLRGMSYVEVEITGPNRDLHSGLYGGAVANPINILTKMVASLHDENNRVTIPGFYDKVEELNAAEREQFKQIPFSLENYQNALDIESVYGEKGYSTLERKSIRPTLDVNGIWGGYIGEGSKTVIPSEAHAKISMRLVPNQNWKKISELFKKHIENITPKTVSVEVSTHHGGNPYVTPEDFKGYESAIKAYKDSFGIDPIPQKDGGSIPIVPMFESILGIKTVLMGFGLDSDAIHSPNENFGVKNFFIGIETVSYTHLTLPTNREV